ncbi:MAG: pilus assembly protein [Burkholderiaceae bacterium]|nr:pilus assembly protein [Burkholderiaceae bacterium]
MRALAGAAPQRGIAALEMVLVLPLLLLFLAAILFFGRYLSYYTTAQKAAHDAVRYLATVSQREMKTPSGAGGLTPVARIAQMIGQQEMAGLHPGPSGADVWIDCTPQPCVGIFIPTKVRVVIQMQVTDELFAPFSGPFLGAGGMPLWVEVSMPYLGQ